MFADVTVLLKSSEMTESTFNSSSANWLVYFST